MRDSKGQAGEAEIVVTAEMVEAGEEAFMATDSRFNTDAETVESIYRAMVLASRKAAIERDKSEG